MEKIRMAVCDDEAEDLAQLLNLIRAYDKQLQVSTFFHAVALLDTTESFDIVFMDIEMSAPNGFEVARKLAMKDPKPLIIFATKSSDYATRGYGIAYRYLTKPISKEDFHTTIHAAIHEIERKHLTFTIKDATYVLRQEELLFAESYGHQIMLHCCKGTYETRGTLRELVEQLPAEYFAMPHKSYLVNLNAIQSASSTELILTDESKLPISRHRFSDFQRRFYRFLGR